MHFKQLFVSLMISLALGAGILPAPVLATGEEEPTTSIEQGSASPDNDEPDGGAIGGGLNTDTVTQPETPAQPSEPSVTKPLPQPADSEPSPLTPSTNDTLPTTPATTSTPTSINSVTTAQYRPQASMSRPNVNQAINSEQPVESTIELETTPVLPSVPNDNIAPMMTIETPNTGLSSTTSTPANPLAILLLVISGVTILSAGIVSTWLSNAERRRRLAAKLTK